MKTFLKEVAGTDNHFRLDEFADTMRSRIVSVFTDALASAKVPVLDVAARYSELGDALLPLINPIITVRYGLEITSFIVENVSVPPEVEQAIDKRSSMAAIGNLNDYVKLQMAEGMAKGTGGGAGGAAAEIAMGFGMAQQMMNQPGGILGAQATPPAGGATAPIGAPPPAPCAGACVPQRVDPNSSVRPTRRKILGVSEADVIATLTEGSLKGKKDRLDLAHHARARSTNF